MASLGSALLLIPGGARAERYLSIEEAQQVCFPQASRFEIEVLRLTPEQSRDIAKQAGGKKPNPSYRIWIARNGTNVLGTLIVDKVPGKHELIDYAVAIAADGKIQQIEILEYRENYGSQIRNAKWREQFKGKTSAAKLKLNDDVYNISGATISCRNVTDGVKCVLAAFDLVVRPRFHSAGRLPDATAKP